MTSSRQEQGEQVIGQRYKLLQQLREEPWGGVWLARDLSLDTEVGLKLLTRESPEWAAALKFYEQEALLGFQLRHPQILGVFHLEKGVDGAYLVEEAFAGESLMAYFARQHRFGLPRTLQMLEQVSQVLAYAQARGTVHQALNPLNILLQGEEIRLANFAFPPAASETAIHLELKAYTAPEVIHGDPVTPAGNVFSLGVLGFRLAAGSLPYPLTFDEAFPYRLEIPPGDLEEIPVPLQNVLLRCLAEDPEERIPAAQALLEQLRQAREFMGGGLRLTPAPFTPTGPGVSGKAREKLTNARDFLGGLPPKIAPWIKKAGESAKSQLETLKAAPRRLWWGLGLAALAALVVVLAVPWGSKSPSPPREQAPALVAAGKEPVPAVPPLVEEPEPPAPVREAPRPAPGQTGTAPPAETTKPAKEERYLVVAATFANQKQAQALQQRLKSRNLPAKTVASKSGAKTLYQVQVGPITGAKAAEDAAARLKAQEKLTPKVVKVTPKKPAKGTKPAGTPKPATTTDARRQAR